MSNFILVSIDSFCRKIKFLKFELTQNKLFKKINLKNAESRKQFLTKSFNFPPKKVKIRNIKKSLCLIFPLQFFLHWQSFVLKTRMAVKIEVQWTRHLN